MVVDEINDAFELAQKAEKQNNVVVVLKNAAFSEDMYETAIENVAKNIPGGGRFEMSDKGVYFGVPPEQPDAEAFQRIVESAIKSAGCTRSDFIVALKTKAQAEALINPAGSYEQNPELAV